MEKKTLRQPKPSIPSPPSVSNADRIEEMYGLLIYVKDAIEYVRAQLAAKRKDHYTVPEFGDLVRRSPYTVRRWIAEGRVKAVRVQGTGPKGRLLVPHDQLDALVVAGMGTEIPAAAMD